MLNQGLVGIQNSQDGATPSIRLGKQGDQIASELHGRFYEQASRGNLFSDGCSINALSANTITLTATTTPILGVYNPPTSGVNLVILQAALASGINNVTSVAPGAFVWASSINNSAITTGTVPFNRKTLTRGGSQAKGLSFIALTGITNALVVIEGADLATASAMLTTTVAAATPTPGVVGVQNFDGGLIVPPGGVLALLNTVSTTTHSVWGRMLWEEVPV